MPNELQDKSAHALGQMIASRDAMVRKLTEEVAALKRGGQPASQLRDAVLPVLLDLQRNLDENVAPVSGRSILARLIAHLKSIPTLEPLSDKVAEKNYGKPYVPLDHGKPER
jgi:hypothetical protein